MLIVRNRFVFIGYIVAAVLLLLFTYTQVDLNLTLSRAGIVQNVQKAFQFVGYYQRSMATLTYGAILVLLFTAYGMLIVQARKNLWSMDAMWRLILIITGVLVFSYPAAFSYDFFNYLFTAKTVVVYHQNPYAVTPLMFAGFDPWTNFMRWTHLTSAYTPLWIFISVVPFVAGLGIFILTMFATKFMIAGFYLLACWALAKSTKSPLSLAVFALNPLMIIESLVSAHNDIVMVAFFLLSFLYYRKDSLVSWLFLGLSVGVKFMTICLVPVYAMKKHRGFMLGSMLLGLVFVLSRREFLPWYFIWILPFVALHAEHIRILRASVFVSLGLAVSYASYVYFGEYSAISQAWKTGSIWIGILIASVSYVLPVTSTRRG